MVNLPSKLRGLRTPSAIASPTPRQPHVRVLPKEIASLQPPEEGRDTPLPQYEKTQAVPFTLTLQEEKENPGQFQLVVTIDPKHQKAFDSNLSKPAASKKLIANLKEVPSLGFDVSQLYQTLKSSPPSSPKEDQQGWSDLDAIPPEFLQKVVPDWKVTFSRSDSTASSQSKKLADIKARIKKSGKGFVVRLLKGSSSENDEMVDVPLGRNVPSNSSEPEVYELKSRQVPVELDGAEISGSSTDHRLSANVLPSEVFEIGTSGEAGIERTAPPPSAARLPSVPHWLSHTNIGRFSMSEEGFSDAETLLADVRSIGDRRDDATDAEPVSRDTSVFPTRSSSVLSIVKTPTRGLSVVGPVQRVEKSSRVRVKGKSARSDLNRSGAHKSMKRRSPRSSINEFLTTGPAESGTARPSVFRETSLLSPPDQSDSSDEPSVDDYKTWHPSNRQLQAQSFRTKRRSSAEELTQITGQKTRLRLRTDVPRTTSANASPVTRRKHSPRTSKSASMSSSVSFANKPQYADTSPVWSEVDELDENREVRIREALKVAFGDAVNDQIEVPKKESTSNPRIEEPMGEGEVGDFSLPPEFETSSQPTSIRSPITKFWGMLLSAAAEKALETLKVLGDTYGSERPVPPGHVRVRWTCSCGEALYDDFVEQKPGAARWLESFLNRPRAHAPSSPSNSRSSTSTSMSSMFDSVSRASTLATPASTYGGPSSWNKKDGRSMYNPTRVQSDSPSFIRMSEESWLLTCANEGRFTPKIVHLDVNEGRIRCDKDLALVLRDHYERLNRRWFNWMRLRGLSTIEFVQFEVHRNRFADIRATPSMPPVSSQTNEKSPSQHPYTFEPVDLVPPVGSAYLLHLFKHPEDYDGEQITYLRSPKRRARLETGMGWGINLVEGFLVQKVWAVVMTFFGIGSGVFAIVWTMKKGDVQGAFGVAGWVVTLAGLVLGSLQAWLD